MYTSLDQADGRSDDDSALVLPARGGDKVTFAVLVERHGAMLRALCRRMLGDAATAEDAAQEAIAQALLNLSRLRDPDRFGGWLGGVGLNVCRRWLRVRSHEGVVVGGAVWRASGPRAYRRWHRPRGTGRGG